MFKKFILCIVGSFFFAAQASAIDVVFRLGRNRESEKSLSTAVLKPLSRDKVLLLPQLGIQAGQKKMVDVALEGATRFWDTRKMAKRVLLRSQRPEWLFLYVPLPKSGSLGVQAFPEFRLDGIRPAVLNAYENPRDALRNEYVAAAVEAGDPSVIWKAYGPRWSGDLGKSRQVLQEGDFQEYRGDEEWVDHSISNMESLREKGCDVGDGTGDYAYPIYLDIDQRLKRATERVLNAVADHFEGYARKRKIPLARAQIESLFRVSSGYRNPSRNRCVGGVYLSRHQWGLALDLSFFPNAGAAPYVAWLFNMDVGELWQRYSDAAARALARGRNPEIHCKGGRLRNDGPNPKSRFSAYAVECGCENDREFVNCKYDADIVNHVHVSF